MAPASDVRRKKGSSERRAKKILKTKGGRAPARLRGGKSLPPKLHKKNGAVRIYSKGKGNPGFVASKKKNLVKRFVCNLLYDVGGGGESWKTRTKRGASTTHCTRRGKRVPLGSTRASLHRVKKETPSRIGKEKLQPDREERSDAEG